MIVDTKLSVVALCAISIQVSSCSQRDLAQHDVDTLKSLETQRLASLVDANIEVASKLHADDFQLITPDGHTYSKEQYLGEISSGTLDYVSWQPSDFLVRVYDDVAAIRYEDSDFVVAFDGEPVWTGNLKHTNLYEKHNGDWFIVWSHASGGGPPENSE